MSRIWLTMKCSFWNNMWILLENRDSGWAVSEYVLTHVTNHSFFACLVKVEVFCGIGVSLCYAPLKLCIAVHGERDTSQVSFGLGCNISLCLFVKIILNARATLYLLIQDTCCSYWCFGSPLNGVQARTRCFPTIFQDTEAPWEIQPSHIRGSLIMRFMKKLAIKTL